MLELVFLEGKQVLGLGSDHLCVVESSQVLTSVQPHQESPECLMRNCSQQKCTLLYQQLKIDSCFVQTNISQHHCHTSSPFPCQVLPLSSQHQSIDPAQEIQTRIMRTLLPKKSSPPTDLHGNFSNKMKLISLLLSSKSSYKCGDFNTRFLLLTLCYLVMFWLTCSSTGINA